LVYYSGRDWGGGGELNARILRIQKRVIRSMVGISSRTSCKELFKELNILTLASLYIHIGSDLFYKKIPPVCGAKFQFIIHEGRWISTSNLTILKYIKKV
jgi:hypothetical protein